MHGVAYGRAYTNMTDYNAAANVAPGGTGAAWEKYWNTFKKNLEACPGDSFTMVVKWVSASNKLTAKINGNERYAETGFATSKIYNGTDRNGHLYLQSHWGSGVVFTSANFSPDKN